MNKTTKYAIATALHDIATALTEDADSMPNPVNLFDYESIGVKVTPEGKVSVPSSNNDATVLNDYFHETVGKSGRTLNHSLNKVRKAWDMNSASVPRGARAIKEVAVDCKLDVIEMCQMILCHPVFSKNAIGDTAKLLLVDE